MSVADREEIGVRHCPLCSSPVPAAARTCPTCGAPLDTGVANGATDVTQEEALPSGTYLNNGAFSVGKVLGRGGFAITYLGADLRLKRAVAIKEFFPGGATRKQANVHFPGTLSQAEYDLAIQKFMHEAQTLARFRHPSIVNVYEVFQENNTAYMVMEYLKGENLLERMERRGGPLREAELVTITRPLAEALDEVHAAGILHRDIKPENIMLVGPEDDPRPVLIDFGAAREFASGMANRHSIVLTPGYAPLEQYGEQARRGPFTDVYALAATLYHVATGEQPPAATERALGVSLKSPRELNPALSPAFDAALMHGLEMKVDQRPQSAIQLYREMAGTGSAAPEPAAPSPTLDWVPPAPQSPAPAPPLPSPAVPSDGTHLGRVRQIARELGNMGAVQTDRFLCPVCRSANMLDESSTVAGTRCPVCRVAIIRERFPAAELLLCPSCSRGTLEQVQTPVSRPDAMLRCPACRSGSVVGYVRSKLLVPDLWARCDNCGADFDYHMQTDSFTLKALPGGPGPLSEDWIGQTKTRAEWAALAGNSAEGYVCPVCAAEFHSCGDGKLEWTARAGNPDQVPAEHRGQCRTQALWAKLAHHIPTNLGTVACPNCDAQLDESGAAQLTLLGAPRDPYGTIGRYGGRTYPAATWRALATGRQSPVAPGLVCPSCTAEMQQLRHGQAYRLVWFDPARDAYATGSRYREHELSPDDWRRIAAGGVPRAKEYELRDEAHREFWAAMLAGQVSTSTAQDSYPLPLEAGEKAVITFTALQLRSRFGFLYEYDGGQIWLTTRRLSYQGDRGDVSVPLSEAAACDVVEAGPGGNLVVEIEGRNRKPLFRFSMGSGPIEFAVDGLALQLQWDESAFVQLFESLRRQV